MPDYSTPIEYRIRFDKDHAQVKATYDLQVPPGSAALIADIQITVDGTNLISGFLPGQTRFNGSRFHTLAHPEQDASVSFSMSSNQGWTASDSDVLRGDRVFDDVEFPA
jgi:hypothetical protein